MTIFSVSRTNHMTVLPQSCDSSHHVTEAHCPSRPTHLLLLHRVDSTNHLVSQEWPGSIPIMFWLSMCHSSTKGSSRILAPPPLNCRNALNYMYTTSRTLPTCDMSLGSPTVAMPEARDFVESLLPYILNPLSHTLVTETEEVMLLIS
jgi:hypothetical protein